MGFTIAVRLHDPTGVPFVFLSLGVGERYRRQGVGSALFRRAFELADAKAPIREIMLGAWLPNEAAERFAAHHRLAFSRDYWNMDRPLGGMPEPVWPAGITVRTFDGSRRAYEDITAAFNDSFADHDHFAPGTVDETKNFFASDLFRPEGLALAYRGEDCVGFCRCTIHPRRGEISVVGTTKGARGIGLGRALLRWGVRWLEAQGVSRVSLRVDGENDNASKLYRQEGFAVTATRRRWTKPGSAR